MAQINTNRASYQRVNPNLKCGKQPKLAASSHERNQLAEIATLRKRALEAKDQASLSYYITEIYRIARRMSESRIKF